MTTFPTPTPITATIDLAMGDVRITADDRTDTVVEVAPSDASNEADVRASERTRVELSDDRLQVIGPKRRAVTPSKKYGSVQVTITLPTGSNIDATSALGAIQATGDLGECRVKTSAGDVRLQDAVSVDLRTAIGAIAAEHIAGDAQCVTGSGTVDIAEIGGIADIKNSNGDTRVGDVGSDVKVKAANGSVRIDRARAGVVATTANGNLSIGCAARGIVTLKTALGRIDVGILAGTATHLDLHTSFGTVHNHLDAASRPTAGETTIEVHAETSAGDIEITRVQSDDA